MDRPAASHDAEHGVLKDTAKVIGGAAGTLTALAKSVLPHHEAAAAPAPAAKRAGKLPPKNKSRLPRKEKKSLGRHKTA
jgi:hypothetical protein